MSQLEKPSRDVLEAVAKQVGARLTHSARQALATGLSLEIGESFPIWLLGLDAIPSSNKDLNTLATDTGLWHHQIRHGSDVKEFARTLSKGPQPADWHFQEVVTSPIAAQIERALIWLEPHISGSPSIRLLIVPALYLHALWVADSNNSSVVIADMPSSMKFLAYQQKYSTEDFLNLLSQERQATGIPPKPPSP